MQGVERVTVGWKHSQPISTAKPGVKHSYPVRYHRGNSEAEGFSLERRNAKIFPHCF